MIPVTRAGAGLATILVAAACVGVNDPEPAPVPRPRPAYPQAPRADVVDVLHGVPVPDPFRPLEDPDAAPTRAWIDAENALTRARLDALPGRDALRARLTELWNYERFGLPAHRGARWFYTRNDGLQNQSVLYVADRAEGPGTPLLDPNELSPDGTVALVGTALTRDGALLAYGLARSGSDWQEWRVRDVATGRDLPDRLEWVKFSQTSWAKDGSGFYYSRYDAPSPGAALEAVNRFQKLCFHRLGEAQSADRVVHEERDQPDRGFLGETTDDGRYLVVNVWVGTAPRNGVVVYDLAQPKAPPLRLLDAFDARYEYVGNDGPTFWFHTDRGAPRGRLIAADLATPAPEAWREVVPESDAALQAVTYVGGRFFCSYLRDARSEVRVFRKDGAPDRDVALPGVGTVAGFHGFPDDAETFFTFMGYANPGTELRYDVATGRVAPLRTPRLPFRPDDFETVQLFAKSKDGTRVPLFASYRKGLVRDGERPTYLYGYGGFNVALTPSFSPAHLAWMERGGVYVEANLRGGSEYGESWHEAGIKARKQNVFDDFAAAAEALCAEGFTRPEKLAIGGHSNGGLLVGATLVQRPQLCAAAICGVGVLDLLRFHRWTIGWAWTSDYGSPDDPADFATLRAYSPYHNLRRGERYPATLITTADHDDRVVPAHSFKFAAALQEAQGADAPILIRIDVKAGHGAGKPVAKQIDEWTDVWSFLLDALGES
jgi:prolyl oligopeptidase